MKTFAIKAAIIFCIIAAFFLGCLILGEPWLFFGVFMIIGFVAALFFALVKGEKFKAVAVVTVFGLVGLFGHNMYAKANLLLEPRVVLAASEETSQTQNTAVEEAPPPVEAPCVYQDRYPAKVAQWCHLIEASAEKYGMDALLIAADILQESGGQPEVISSSGAVGLMQVMPRDGISASFMCINGPCFANRPTIEELKDPAFNIDFGVRYLSGLVEKWGDIREALYHYGPMDVGYSYADKVLAIRNEL